MANSRWGTGILDSGKTPHAIHGDVFVGDLGGHHLIYKGVGGGWSF